MSYVRPSIHIPAELHEQIVARGPRSTIISRDLTRLYTLYRRALAQIELSVDEACLIVDALNGSLMDANSARLLWASIEDACKLDALDAKWNVDGAQLMQKLQQLNELQAMALVDAAERLWEEVTRCNEAGEPTDIREMVKPIFMIKDSL